ncbi:MAG: NUDIX hydrolase [Chloroflexia bacterium]|nr:NUDIX hydrolase [Chloroflexia bacterium]
MRRETLPVKYCMECGTRLRRAGADGKERLCCAACGWVHWEDPKLAVAVIVFRDRTVLLGRRGQGARQGLWSFPAGFVDRGERVEDAAIREVREETGLDVALGPLFMLRSATDEPVVLAVYSATHGKDAPTPGIELTDIRWFARGDLPEMAFEHDAAVLAAWWDSQEELE